MKKRWIPAWILFVWAAWAVSAAAVEFPVQGEIGFQDVFGLVPLPNPRRHFLFKLSYEF